MSIRALYIGDDDGQGIRPRGDAREPGDPLPGENIKVSRKPPAPLPKQDAPGNGYGATRANGVQHWGIDIARSPDADVVAPERGVIVDVWTDNETPNFQGYGPGGVLLKGQSGVFHLLAHLNPARWGRSNAPTIGEVFEAGQLIGHTAGTGTEGVGRAAPHVHWEVRVKPHDTPATRAGNTIPPRRWLAGNPSGRVLSEATPSKSDNGWLLLLLLVALGSKRR